MIVAIIMMRNMCRYKYRNDYGNICINGYVYMGTYIDRYCLRTIPRSCYAILAGFYFVAEAVRLWEAKTEARTHR